MLFVFALIAASVAYWFLQDLEDRKADRAGAPRATTARRAVLWFFLCIFALVLLHLAGFGGASGGGRGASGGAEAGAPGPSGAALGARGVAYDPSDMLRRIPEDIQVGARSPF